MFSVSWVRYCGKTNTIFVTRSHVNHSLWFHAVELSGVNHMQPRSKNISYGYATETVSKIVNLGPGMTRDIGPITLHQCLCLIILQNFKKQFVIHESKANFSWTKTVIWFNIDAFILSSYTVIINLHILVKRPTKCVIKYLKKTFDLRKFL